MSKDVDLAWMQVKRVYGKTRRLGVAKIDLFGVVRDCNACFADILGGDRAAVIGKSVIQDFTFPQDQELTQERFRQLQKGEEDIVSSSKTLRCLNGSAVDVFLEACLIRSGDNDPRYVIDGLWVDDDKETERRIEEFEELLASFKSDQKGGQTIHIGTKAGRDYTGRDKMVGSADVWVYATIAAGVVVFVLLLVLMVVLIKVIS